MDAREAERRASRTDAVEQLFRERPLEWISVGALMKAGGLCAWRTRVADARRRFQRRGDGTIEWNRSVEASAYRYVPHLPIERAGEAGVPQRSLF